jgi:hypothetical protein
MSNSARKRQSTLPWMRHGGDAHPFNNRTAMTISSLIGKRVAPFACALGAFPMWTFSYVLWDAHPLAEARGLWVFSLGENTSSLALSFSLLSCWRR